VTDTPETLRSRRDWESIKAHHRLADVARRSGLDVPTSGRVMVCCPTPGHPDFTPSMQLDLDRDRYWCFGCASHGDVIDWVRDIEQVDTATAIDVLESGRSLNAVFASRTARRATLAQGHEPPQLDRTSAARVAAANTLAWHYYSSPTLHERGAAYLTERGVAVVALEAELTAPVVGHTPSSKTRIDGLTTFLTREGFAEHEIIDAGLATRLADGCVIDFFRDRVIIPVKGPTGTVIGFLGRDITERSKVKYLNPPTTAIYQKSRTLYRPSTHTLDAQASTIVCEGPIDALAIAAHAADARLSRYFAPVAGCGRALSDAQIDLILAVHPRAPVLAADGDPSGQEANLDWATCILAKGRESVITTWPDGHDPCSWLAARGPHGLRAVTRTGCMEDHTGVLRPRHCGAVLTEAAFPDHDQHDLPDPRALVRALGDATGNLGPAGRQRYIAAAAPAVGISPQRLTHTAPSLGLHTRASPHPTAAHTHPDIAPAERIPL
jgi:DNA primase